MKLLLIDQVPEVNDKYSFSLAKAIKSEGVDITFCGTKTQTDKTKMFDNYITLFDNYSKVGNLVKKVVCYDASWKRIVRYCKDNCIDVVHVQWFIFSPLDYRYIKQLKKMGIKVVATIHDLLPFNTKFYDFYFHKKIYNMVDAIISQADKNIERLVNEFGVDRSKIQYIPHGHFMEYADKATKEESRKYLDISSDKKVILFFGQIKKVKGIDILIKALPQVINKHKDVVCVIAGKVWKDDFAQYDTLIDKLGLGEYVIKHIRYIEDDEIKYFFNAADFVAMPYREIYQSGVVLLSYAYRKPVVATTEGEFVNVVKNNETGILVPSENENAFAEGLNWYLDNPERIAEFGQAGYEDLNVRLSWTTIAKDIVTLYKGL